MTVCWDLLTGCADRLGGKGTGTPGSFPRGGRAGEGGLWWEGAWVHPAPGRRAAVVQGLHFSPRASISSFLSHDDDKGPDLTEFCENYKHEDKLLRVGTAMLYASVNTSYFHLHIANTSTGPLAGICYFTFSVLALRGLNLTPQNRAPPWDDAAANGCNPGPSIIQRQGRASIAKWKMSFLQGRENLSALMPSRDMIFSPTSPPTWPIRKDKRGPTPAPPSPTTAHTDRACVRCRPHTSESRSTRTCRPHPPGSAHTDKGVEITWGLYLLFLLFFSYFCTQANGKEILRRVLEQQPPGTHMPGSGCPGHPTAQCTPRGQTE